MKTPTWYRRAIEYFGLDAIHNAKQNRELREQQAKELESLRKEVDYLKEKLEDPRT